MKRLTYAVAVVLLSVVSFTAGVWWPHRGEAPPSAGAADVLAYTCPMHPQYRSDRPGACPLCGMALEPVHAETESAPAASDGRSVPPGAVHVSPERQQAVGVRLGVAERASGTRILRTTGRVAPDENATYPIVAGVSGWIRDVRQATTGSQVKKDEILASFYAPDFVSIQQSYFSALETLARVSNQELQTFNQNRSAEGVQRFADTLRNLGVSEMQLEDMSRKRELVKDIYITSPVNGFLLQRNVSVGLRFDRGFEFCRIADLRRVWILADLYENQLPFIRPGMKARATSRDQNRQFDAEVSRAEPTFDEATRTLKVRLDAANPGTVLKPGMFVDVEFAIELPSALVVPADAIVDTGLRKTVFVGRGDGYFEPRQVETGWRLGEQVEIIKGLMDGEQIVISGTFLIDSESRMKAAAMGVFGTTVKDPVCGMAVDEQRSAAGGMTIVHEGKTFHFCSDDCKRRFHDDPGRYLTAHDDPVPSHAPSKPAADSHAPAR